MYGKNIIFQVETQTHQSYLFFSLNDINVKVLSGRHLRNKIMLFIYLLNEYVDRIFNIREPIHFNSYIIPS